MYYPAHVICGGQGHGFDMKRIIGVERNVVISEHHVYTFFAYTFLERYSSRLSASEGVAVLSENATLSGCSSL